MTSATNTAFTINNTSGASIYGANSTFNLTRGTLRTANSNQTIKARAYNVIDGDGDGINVIANARNTQVADIDSNEPITGLQNDTFTIDDKQYRITGTTAGVTFIIKDGKVTIADVTAADGDIFTSNGIKYTAYGVGFVRDNSVQADRYRIWNNGDSGIYNHTLKGNSLTADDLTNTSNWDSAATVSASNRRATIPSFIFSDTVTLVGDDFARTYGTLTRDGTSNNYALNRDNTEPQLTRVSVSGVDELAVGDGFVNTRIDAAVASLIVTADDGEPGYKVTLTSAVGETSVASISGANQASLISGTLKADKNIAISVRDNAHSTNKVITAGDGVTLTIMSANNSSDASIVGMSTGEQFSLDGADKYRFSKVGLVDANDHYLLGTKKGNAIKLSAINTSSMWGGLMDVHALTIDASTNTALIVNDTSNPVSLYADFVRSGNTRNLTKSEGADDWQDDFVVNVENTSVNAESYFSNKTFHGVNSGATFIIPDATAFSVSDSTTGASIGTAKRISQTAGNIALSNGQTVEAVAATISASVGNGINYIVNGDAATIAALETSVTGGY